MRQFVPWFAAKWIAAAVFVPFYGAVNLSAAIAHQDMMSGNVKATVHLVPDDSPFAGEASQTWIDLTRVDGEQIPLVDCNCNLMVYDSQNQLIAQPQLTETTVEGHGRPMSTNITFPSAGTYQLVFTAQPTSNQFEPFELKIPVTVRP
jgi:hypothetical protein